MLTLWNKLALRRQLFLVAFVHKHLKRLNNTSMYWICKGRPYQTNLILFFNKINVGVFYLEKENATDQIYLDFMHLI